MIQATGQKTDSAVLGALRELARVAEAVVDGDESLRIISDRAYWYIAAYGDPGKVQKGDPRSAMIGDYFDVDHGRFLTIKKLLLRLGRLAGFELSSCLWVRVTGAEHLLTLAQRNGAPVRYAPFREWCRKPDGPLRDCLESGELVCVPEDGDGLLTALAPLRDSLGDVVGVIEFTAPAANALPAIV